MKFRQAQVTVALMAALALSACGSPSDATQGQPQQAQQQFLEERGGGAAAPMGGGASGTIEKIEGDTITLKGQDGATTTVKLAANAMIRRESHGDASDAKPGQTMTAVGTKEGDTLKANAVHLGGPLLQGNVTAVSPGGADVPVTVSGTIDTVDGNTVVVKLQDGKTESVDLANAEVSMDQELTLADLESGANVMALGSKDGDVFAATELRVIEMSSH
jgi:preprotein translocase subunit YajC